MSEGRAEPSLEASKDSSQGKTQIENGIYEITFEDASGSSAQVGAKKTDQNSCCVVVLLCCCVVVFPLVPLSSISSCLSRSRISRAVL